MNFYLYSGQLDEENLFEEISDMDLIQLTASQESAVLQSIITDSSPQLLMSKRVVAPPRSKKSLQTKRQTLTLGQIWFSIT